MMTKRRLKREGRNEEGHLIKSQKPNLPIIVAIISSALALALRTVPNLNTLLVAIAFGSWFTWAWLELFQGLNVFRRILGGVTMALLLTVLVLGVQLFVIK